MLKVVAPHPISNTLMRHVEDYSQVILNDSCVMVEKYDVQIKIRRNDGKGSEMYNINLENDLETVQQNYEVS